MLGASRNIVLVLALFTLTRAPIFAQAPKAKVFRQVSAEQLEGLLKELKIQYVKMPNQLLGVMMYDFTRINVRIRLQNWNGNDLAIDALFAKIPLEDVNRWNRDARLSRAVQLTGPAEGVILESHLDCSGGVTDGMIHQFITGFDKEVLAFTKFLRSLVQEEETIKAASPELLEKIFDALKWPAVKSEHKGSTCFEFERNKYKVKLHCHQQGAALVLETTFPKMSLEKINRYNNSRRFIRVALRQDAKGKEYVSLESYLDCQGGVTESVLRYFLTIFDQEVKEFGRVNHSV